MNLIKRQQLKRFAGIFILSAFLINSYAPVLVQAAQPGTEAQKPEEKKEEAPAVPKSYNWEIQSDKIKGWPFGPKVAAETAILMDLDNQNILYAKNIDEKRYPASTTKVMTALLAIENSTPDEQVTFSAKAVNSIEPGSTHIGIKPNEILTMEQSLYAILLASANEVSNGVAEHIAGTIPAFVDMMNERAAALGCTNTHFTNPSGLHNDDHYTTARDLAVISCEAFKNEMFRNIIKTPYFIEPKTNITDEERWLNNHHKMITDSALLYEGCLGGKTGYTTDAGNTLVTYAERNGLRLCCVVLADANLAYSYSDTAAILDYGFANFEHVTLEKSGEKKTHRIFPSDAFLFHTNAQEVIGTISHPAIATLPIGFNTNALTKTYHSLPSAWVTEYFLGDEKIAASRLNLSPFSMTVSEAKAPESLVTFVLQEYPLDESEDSSDWKLLLVLFLIGAAVFYLITLVIHLKRKRKSRRKRNKKRGNR